MDPQAEEKSVYNALPFRNRAVLNGSGSLSGLTPPENFATPDTHLGIYTRIHPAWGSGLNELSRRHSGKFGIDSTYGTIRADDYDTTASYQKVPRNVKNMIKYGNSAYDIWGPYNFDPDRYVTASVYDNLFINHSIPQSELQYAWLSESLANAANHPLVGYTSYMPGYDGQVSGANGFEDPIKFGTGKFPKYSGYSADIVGLNTLVVETLNTGSNLISLDTDYRNTDFATVPDGKQFSVLMNHRSQRHGASWKMQFKSDNPLVRNQRKYNVVDVIETREVGSMQTSDATYWKDQNANDKSLIVRDIKKFTVPPVTSKFKPLIHDLADKDDNEILLTDTYSNNFDFMASADIDLRLDLKQTEKQLHDVIMKDVVDGTDVKLDKLVYKEVVYPKEENTYLAKVRGRINFAEASGSAVLNQRLGDQRTIWKYAPIDRKRQNLIARNSQDFRMDMTPGSSSNNGRGDEVEPLRFAVPALSVWPLDGQILTASAYQYNLTVTNNYYGGSVVNNQPPGGYKQNANGELVTYTHTYLMKAISQAAFPVDDETSRWGCPATASLQFYYPNAASTDYVLYEPERHQLFTLGSKFSTFNFNQVGRLSGKSPWYDSYEDYAQDIRLMGQNHTVIPEFRISEHMDYYIDNGFSFNNEFLTLEGTTISASANSPTASYNEDFFKIYSHSDFMQHFAKFNKDESKLDKFSLTCHGVKKLLPYNGFYPALRTVQLGSEFSRSYGAFIDGSKAAQTGSYEAERLISLLQPFFAPGLMYNTIKAGISVDFPVVTGTLGEGDLAGGGQTVFSWGADEVSGYLSSSGNAALFNFRMPFEALITPERYLPVSASDQSSNLNYLYPGTASFPEPVYATWKGENKVNYSLAVNNFLAEIPRFFLKDQNFTSFASKKESEYKMMKSGSTYYMDVELYKTDHMVQSEGYTEVQFCETTSSSGAWQQVTSSRDYRGMLFGPACDIGIENLTIPVVSGSAAATYSPAVNITDPAFAPYTPPYLYGGSIARITFTPHERAELLENESKLFTLDEILAGARLETSYTSSYNELTNLLQWSADNGFAAGVSQMRLSSSLNLFGKTSIKKVFYEASETAGDKFVPKTLEESTDSSNDVWTIGPKFECPTINVSASLMGEAYQTLKEASLAYNMDNNPTNNTKTNLINSPKSVWGVYGRPPSGSEGIFLRIKESYPDVVLGTSASGIGATTGSLIDVCGFEKSEKRIGNVATEKEISEAVVAIPFVQRKGKRKFFPVLKTQVKYVLGLANKGEVTLLQKNGKLPGDSITDMVNTLKKYVLPPQLDFITNRKINPYVAYVFEFTHKLDRDDLADIWQNLMPKIATTAEEQEVTISHSMTKNEFFAGKPIPDDTQWMVFKVKKRAAYNYFAATADATDDERFAFQFEIGGEKKTPDYSYNWPYDYFSLVELAQIGAEAEFKMDLKKQKKAKKIIPTPEAEGPVTPEPVPTPPTDGSSY
jgi:hypothetical protein